MGADLPQPVPPVRIARGKRYWTPWGKRGWSEVEILSTARIWARAKRVSTGGPASVRLDRLFLERPSVPPGELFTDPAPPVVPTTPAAELGPKNPRWLDHLMALGAEMFEEDEWR